MGPLKTLRMRSHPSWPMIAVTAMALASGGVRSPASVWAAAPTAPDPGRADCPPDKVAGQIAELKGPADQIALTRAGRPAPLYRNRCILFGDRLTVGKDAAVRVWAAGGAHTYGGDGGEAPVWAPVSRGRGGGRGGPASLSGALGMAWATLFSRDTGRHEYAVGRGLADCRPGSDTPQQPISAVSRLPVVPQTVGSDLAQLAVAWRGGDVRTRVSLTDADGAVVAGTQVCRAALAELDLPEGRLKPGQHLTLTVQDMQGEALRYSIEVVAPERLARPKRPALDWLVGAWRLVGDDKALRLDALSRVAHGADTDYAAWRLAGAVEADEAF